MTTPTLSPSRQEQQKKLLKAKIAVALHNELGRVPKQEAIDQAFILARVPYKALLGLHYRKTPRKPTALVVG